MINTLRLFSVVICLFLMTFMSYAGQIEINGFTMGTYYSIKYINKDNRLSVDVAKQHIDAKLERVNEQMSTYRPDSELSRFNKYDEINKPFLISDELAFVIASAIEVNQFTEGGLDITIGPLVNLWGFGPEQHSTQLPSKAQVEQRMQMTGIEKLHLQGNVLTKSIPGLYLDLSAIAKGYGVDVVAEYLQSQDIEHYMVDIGGEIRAKGLNQQGEGWRIAIEKPGQNLTRQVYEIIQLKDQSVATSGSYRNYFNNKNQHYSHTIDPKTGYPILHKIVSISVIHDSCMYADALATGFNVLGIEKSINLANREGIAIMIIAETVDGLKSYYSDAFKAITEKKTENG